MVYSIDEIKDKLKNYDIPKNVEKIFLFGSYARNEATDKSDLDFYIEHNQPCDRTSYTLWCPFEELFKKKIDILVKNDLKLDPFIRDNVEREKVIVYERN